MEPKKQVEIQLGHLCNNRCVFCVSGQETALGRARPLSTAPILAEITRAHEDGHRKITLLGGEPTLQPGFLDVVKHAVALGFEEIVIFTNGVKTARESFIDEILATGGKFTWRISLQGATREAHERTTKKEGSFDRLTRTMETLARKGQRITVNMCVVSSNWASVIHFPELLLPVGVTELHLDMVRPLDAGARSEDELRAMIPRYSDMVPALEAMVRGFPEGFDVNIGNLPYCIAPGLARVIHHDGERTLTIAVDGSDRLSKPWDKYLVKRRDKVKPEACGGCVFEGRCNGIFEAYPRFHGTSEIVAVTPEKLETIDPEGRLLALRLRPLVAHLARMKPPPPFDDGVSVREISDTALVVEMRGASEGGARLAVELGPPGAGAGSFDLFGVQIVEAHGERSALLAALRTLWTELGTTGRAVIHPLGDDALTPVARSIGARLSRLRERAPFGALGWRDVIVSEGGRRAEALFEGPGGERATVWLGEQGGRAVGGYRVDGDEATPLLVEGIGAIMAALKRG